MRLKRYDLVDCIVIEFQNQSEYLNYRFKYSEQITESKKPFIFRYRTKKQRFKTVKLNKK